MTDDRAIIRVDATPVREPQRPASSMVAKTVSICVNCVVAPGRVAARMARRRHERHYHPRHRFGRYHLAVDIGLAVAIAALLGVNGYFFSRIPSNARTTAVQLSWRVAPATVRSGEAITFTLAFRHDGDEAFEDVTVALRLPEHVLVRSVAPTPYDDVTHTVRLGTLAPGASGQVIVRGITDAPDGETLRIEGTLHGTGMTRSERVVASGTADVRGATVAFEMSPVGIGQTHVLRRGLPQEITVWYRGVGDDPTSLDAQALRVLVSGSIPVELTTHSREAVVRRNEIRWPFERLRSARHVVGATFAITPTADHVLVPGQPTSYRFTPEIILAADAEGVPTARLVGSPLILEVAGELSVAAIARYFTVEGDQMGRGPLPPRIGHTTTYWVTWDAQALLRNADQVVVRAVLPTGVEWTGRVTETTGVEPTFDTGSRTVTWTIGALGRSASASFELAATPTASHAGSFMTLLEQTTARGVDDLGTALTVIAPAVTTELVLDQRAHGKGKVMR
ncbi:hypothetical protein HY480_02940 [Candidatus Uhrbacteria bacterium]|nr:hypothetical protein [Candidatus Uhrbacteria bacterium]